MEMECLWSCGVLRYFLAAAREESISGAANYLHLSQPTLSRQLMELEEELGKKLFVRGSRKVTLTEEGRLLRKRADEILALVEKTQAELHSEDHMISGDIYIGGGETEAMRLLARTARKLRSRCPGVRYHLYSGNGDAVSERLDKGLLDFGVVIEPFDRRKYDFLRLPHTDRWGVLMRRDSPLADREQIYPEDLRDQPILHSGQSRIWESLLEWFGCDVNQLNIVGTYNLVYNDSLMVEEGLGYALCLDGLINTTGDSPLCFRPLAHQKTAELDLVWKKYQVFSKTAERFLELLREEIANENGK